MKYRLVDANRDDFSALILLEQKAAELAKLAELLRNRREGEAEWAAAWISAARKRISEMKSLLDEQVCASIICLPEESGQP